MAQAPSEASGKNRQRSVWGLVLVAVLSSALFQGSRGLYETTEGRYAECARECFHSRDWDDPILNGQPHWTKPPLTYMAIAAGLAVFGENTWGVRAYLFVAFALTLLAVAATANLIWGSQAAPYCTLVYATSPFVLGTAGMVSTDVLLTMWEAIGILCFWMAVRSRKSRWMILMWAVFGLAFMTKGPPGLLPLTAIVVTNHRLRRQDRSRPHSLNPLALAAFAVVGLSWFVAEGLEHEGLMRYWLMHETIGRNLHGEFNRNPQFYKAFVVYLPVVLFGAGQWAVLLLAKRKALPWPANGWRAWRTWPHADEWFYLATALAIPLAILSLSTSKLALYALPLLIPISLSLGRGLQWLVEQRHIQVRTMASLALGMALLCAIAKPIAARIENPSDMAQLAGQVRRLSEQYPGRAIESIKPVALNGLEFYLDRLVPNTLPENAAEHLQATPSASGSRIVIVAKNDLGKLPASALTRFQQQPLGRYWVALLD